MEQALEVEEAVSGAAQQGPLTRGIEQLLKGVVERPISEPRIAASLTIAGVCSQESVREVMQRGRQGRRHNYGLSQIITCQIPPPSR